MANLANPLPSLWNSQNMPRKCNLVFSTLSNGHSIVDISVEITVNPLIINTNTNTSVVWCPVFLGSRCRQLSWIKLYVDWISILNLPSSVAFNRIWTVLGSHHLKHDKSQGWRIIRYTWIVSITKLSRPREQPGQEGSDCCPLLKRNISFWPRTMRKEPELLHPAGGVQQVQGASLLARQFISEKIESNLSNCLANEM